MKFKAVLFDLGGVILPQPQLAILKYGQNLKLPQDFLPQLFTKGVPNNAFCKLETGVYTFSQFVEEFEKEALNEANLRGFDLPKNFSALDLFANFGSNGEKTQTKFALPNNVRLGLLHASIKLRQQGIITCVLTNNWINDQPGNFQTEKFMQTIKFYFNDVLESSKLRLRKPDKKIYWHACQQLGVRPEETIFLDDIGLNLKYAKEIGITCIKVKDPAKALEKLQELTGIDLSYTINSPLMPPPCKSDSVPHCHAQISKQINMHYVDVGEGPAVLLLHGFPDCWYGWRYQIPSLVCAGYRVIVPDQRGYGDTTCPYDVAEYSQEKLCADVISLLDILAIPQATVVGHDWGGSIAWNLALAYPNRFRAVCGVNTPYFKVNPKNNPLESMKKNPGVFDYQLYFQDPGVAEKEFEKDIERTLTLILQGVQNKKSPTEGLENNEKKKMNISTANVRERGGMLVGLPEKMKRSPFLSKQDMDYYVQQFKKSGFRGPLNWYRNYEANWEWGKPICDRKITIPSLMVTADKDLVLQPKYSFGMEKNIPNLTRLHIERCSHWTGQEQPGLLNQGLIKWLNEIHQNATPKL